MFRIKLPVQPNFVLVRLLPLSPLLQVKYNHNEVFFSIALFLFFWKLHSNVERGVNSLLCFLDWVGVGIQLMLIEYITGCLSRWFRGRCCIRNPKVHYSWKKCHALTIHFSPKCVIRSMANWEWSSECLIVFSGSQIVCKCLWGIWGTPFITKWCPHCWKSRNMTGGKKIWEHLIIKFEVPIKSTDSLKVKKAAILESFPLQIVYWHLSTQQ